MPQNYGSGCLHRYAGDFRYNPLRAKVVTGAAEGCRADRVDLRGLRSSPGRRRSHHLGRAFLWRRQQCSAGEGGEGFFEFWQFGIQGCPLAGIFMVQDELEDVLLVRSTSFAFAALRRDGRVVTWGCPASGGDSTSVHQELQNVHQFLSPPSAHQQARGLKRNLEQEAKAEGMLAEPELWGNSNSCLIRDLKVSLGVI